MIGGGHLLNWSTWLVIFNKSRAISGLKPKKWPNTRQNANSPSIPDTYPALQSAIYTSLGTFYLPCASLGSERSRLPRRIDVTTQGAWSGSSSAATSASLRKNVQYSSNKAALFAPGSSIRPAKWT